MPVNHRALAQIAPRQAGVELGQCEITAAQGGAVGADHRILPAALAGQGDGRFEAAGHRRERQSREIVEVARRQVHCTLGQERIDIDRGAPVDGAGAEIEGQVVEGPGLRHRPAEVDPAPKGLAADLTAQPKCAGQRTGEVRQRHLHAKVADRAAERLGIGYAEGRGQIWPFEGTGEAPVEGGPTGELRLECGEILEVDVEPGIGETRGGASLQTGDDLRPVEARALEGVAVIDLGEAPAEMWALPEQAIAGGQAEGERPRAQIDVGGHRLAGWVAAQIRLGCDTAGERPTGDVGEYGYVAQGGLNGAGERILADFAGVGGLGGRPLDAEGRYLDDVIGLECTAEGEGGPRADRPTQGWVGEQQALDPRIGTEGEAAGIRVRPGGLGAESRLDAVESTTLRAQARGLERAIYAGAGERTFEAAVEDEAVELGLRRLGDGALGRHRAG